MSSPVFVPLNTGDPNDDDPQVIDSFFVETDTPPTPVVEPVDTTTLVPPKVETKLITNSLLIDPAWDRPTPVLPGDVNRTYLYIRIRSAVATDGVFIMSDPNPNLGTDTLNTNNTGAGRILAGGDITLSGHTGPVYVSAKGSSATVFVDYWAVTS